MQTEHCYWQVYSKGIQTENFLREGKKYMTTSKPSTRYKRYVLVVFDSRFRTAAFVDVLYLLCAFLFT